MAEAARQAVAPRPTVALRSQRFGAYDVPEDCLVTFPAGLVGLPEAHRFALLEPSRPGSPFRYLICVDLPELGFVVCDASALSACYASDLPRPPDTSRDLAVLAIVTVPPNAREMTANLMAPLLVDCASRQGWQVVLDTGRYSTRHPLLAPAEPDATSGGG